MTTAAGADKSELFTAAAGQALREPLLYVAATTPIWSKWLSAVSEIAAQLGPIVAIVLAIARIWVILHERRNGSESVNRVEKATGMAGTAVATAAKLGTGKYIAGALGALGLVALAAWMLSPSPAKAQPARIVSSMPANRKRKSADDAGEDDGPMDGATFDTGVPPQWYLNARADIGQHERPGRMHNPVIVKYFRDAGHPEIKDDETAWCAAFVGANLERCGVTSSKSLSARSYEKWGSECEPRAGCVVVMWRGSKSGWEGHVGFYVGETETHVLVLGGNQGDSVSIAKFPKGRVLSYRWPRKPTESRTVRAAAASALLGGGGQGLEEVKPETAKPLLEAIEPVQGSLSQLAPFVPVAAKICAALAVMLAIYAAYRRWQDYKATGR